MPESTPSRSDLANKYCRSTDLSNEASVESFFVLRMLADLGYEDREVKTKQSIDEILGVCPRNNVLNDMRHWWSVKMLITPLQSPECCKQVIAWRVSSPGTNPRTGS